MTISEPIGVTPQPWRAHIGPIIEKPPRERGRSIEIMTINRGGLGQPAVDASDQLGFIRPVVLPMQGKRARLFGDQSLEVRHSRKAISAGDAVNLPVPGAAAKVMIEPFDGGARQPMLVAAQEI